MFGRFIKYKKWFDFINTNNIEVRISIVATLLFLIFAERIELYSNLVSLSPQVTNLISCLIGGFITLLGLLISGVAIVIGIFDSKQSAFIRKVAKRDVIGEVLVSFEFIGFNIGILILYLITAYFYLSTLLDSQKFFKIK